jgi:putative membrane protein
MKMSSFFNVMAAIAAAMLVCGVAEAAPTAQAFVQQATIANMFEIQSSQLALQKGQNQAVKKFAQHMIDDHMKAGNQLKTTVSKANIGLVTVPTSLDAEHQKIEDKLSSARAGDFDKDYIQAQANAHVEAIGLFKSYAGNGDSAALKTFAQQMLPTLKEHKSEVEELQKADKEPAAESLLNWGKLATRS